mmetsp:Transcript_24396/g.57417  ORF Transcript_24396/g.57417 Transcript_24396/m.57417 type:complete len:154 (+) Transcript_24396:1930-2391(+)
MATEIKNLFPGCVSNRYVLSSQEACIVCVDRSSRRRRLLPERMRKRRKPWDRECIPDFLADCVVTIQYRVRMEVRELFSVKEGICQKEWTEYQIMIDMKRSHLIRIFPFVFPPFENNIRELLALISLERKSIMVTNAHLSFVLNCHAQYSISF